MMNIHIGDKLGSQYEYYKYYLPFVIKTNIRFVKPLPLETIIYRQYEMFKDFLPYNHDLVLDIGAYYGDYSIIWSKLYGAKVIAFEPLLYNFITAKTNIILNNANVKIYNVAIGNRNEYETMFGNDMINNFDEGKAYIINKITLDDFQGINNYSDVDLVKIDVEGFELEVLIGAEKLIRYGKPKIILETHTSDLKRICTNYLQNLGYELKHIGREQSSSGAMNLISELYFEMKK